MEQLKQVLRGDPVEERQQTLKQSLTIQGEALHTGKMVTMTLIPQPEDTGIRFCRSDLPGKPVLPARPEHVVDTYRCTTIGNNTWQIKTIEHLMAALHGLGVDNLLVEVEGEELPMSDGSAWVFARAILEAGLVEQRKKSRRKWKITTPVWVRKRKLSPLIPAGFTRRPASYQLCLYLQQQQCWEPIYQLRVTPGNLPGRVGFSTDHCLYLRNRGVTPARTGPGR